MRICDSSYLIAFLHPNPSPPRDRQGKPVARFEERIGFLIETLSASGDIIGIPTPALAETLVRSGPQRAQYMKILGDSWRFQIIPFDSRAAIEAAELVATVKNSKDKWDTWAKVKFDIQIVAMAKAEGASVIYSDDIDIENYAKRFGISVVRICDLPLPPEKACEPGLTGLTGQIDMFPSLPQPKELPFPLTGAVPDVPAPLPTEDSTMATTQQAQEPKTDTEHPPSVQASDLDRAEDEIVGGG